MIWSHQAYGKNIQQVLECASGVQYVEKFPAVSIVEVFTGIQKA